ncbi:MAG: hypothetical protein MUF49_32740 [Oculatellaceae cyanobacterium Prado106]|nr:hypothetical protein [Oculatellaceae cyanobacterium Prado106]
MAFHQIVQLLQQTIGLAPHCLSDRALLQAIRQRQISCGTLDLMAYWHYLQTSTAEVTQLVEAIVVSETWFFRDYQPFVYLAQFVQQDWLPQHPYRRLRVLSLPCATGEEPYSIAITLLETGLAPQRFQIDAIDVSQAALDKAKRAIYEQHSFREKRFVERDRYFQVTSSGYQLNSAVQSTVQFRQANLLDAHAFFTASHYDVIFCRNLLIYLDEAARKIAIATLSHLLTEDGILFVGHSELSLLTSLELLRVRHPFTFAVRKDTSPKITASKSILGKPNLSKPALPKPDSSQSKPLQPPATVQHTSSPVKPANPPTPLSSASSSVLEQAQELANQGQLQAAIALCQTYLSATPTDAEAQVLFGTLQQAIGQDREAERSFQQALYLDPYHEEALMHLMLLKEQSGEPLHAEALRQRLQRL